MMICRKCLNEISNFNLKAKDVKMLNCLECCCKCKKYGKVVFKIRRNKLISLMRVFRKYSRRKFRT